MKIMETTENRQERGHYYGHHRHKAGWIALGIIGFVAIAFLFGAVVMGLWNWLMPGLFHLGMITYWQAVGLALLGRLLFGGFHHGGHGRGFHRHGPWMRGHMMGRNRRCGEHGSYGARWGYYDQYWNEEGEKAFNDYIERKKQAETKV